MSPKVFHLKDDTTNDTSIIKRDCMKIYHQQRAQLNTSHQSIDLFFRENNNYHQIGNGYLDFDITLEKRR